MATPSILDWIHEERQPSNYYELLGTQLLDPGCEGICAKIRESMRQLLTHDVHAVDAVSKRIRRLQMSLAKAEAVFSNPREVKRYEFEIIESLRQRYGTQNRSDRQSAEKLSQLLSREQKIHPARLTEVVEKLLSSSNDTSAISVEETSSLKRGEPPARVFGVSVPVLDDVSMNAPRRNQDFGISAARRIAASSDGSQSLNPWPASNPLPKPQVQSRDVIVELAPNDAKHDRSALASESRGRWTLALIGGCIVLLVAANVVVLAMRLSRQRLREQTAKSGEIPERTATSAPFSGTRPPTDFPSGQSEPSAAAAGGSQAQTSPLPTGQPAASAASPPISPGSSLPPSTFPPPNVASPTPALPMNSTPAAVDGSRVAWSGQLMLIEGTIIDDQFFLEIRAQSDGQSNSPLSFVAYVEDRSFSRDLLDYVTFLDRLLGNAEGEPDSVQITGVIQQPARIPAVDGVSFVKLTEIMRVNEPQSRAVVGGPRRAESSFRKPPNDYLVLDLIRVPRAPGSEVAFDALYLGTVAQDKTVVIGRHRGLGALEIYFPGANTAELAPAAAVRVEGYASELTAVRQASGLQFTRRVFIGKRLLDSKGKVVAASTTAPLPSPATTAPLPSPATTLPPFSPPPLPGAVPNSPVAPTPAGSEPTDANQTKSKLLPSTAVGAKAQRPTSKLKNLPLKSVQGESVNIALDMPRHIVMNKLGVALGTIAIESPDTLRNADFYLSVGRPAGMRLVLIIYKDSRVEQLEWKPISPNATPADAESLAREMIKAFADQLGSAAATR